jgi:dihydrofolate synthase/folylpolyglutamate synthase
VVLDGAHNSHAARVLADTWLNAFPENKAALVFSAVADKEVGEVLEILAPLAAKIFLCPIDTPRAASTTMLAAALPAAAPPHETFQSFEAAFTAAQTHGAPILVTGSLFLVGEARAFLTGTVFQSSSQ